MNKRHQTIQDALLEKYMFSDRQISVIMEVLTDQEPIGLIVNKQQILDEIEKVSTLPLREQLPAIREYILTAQAGELLGADDVTLDDCINRARSLASPSHYSGILLDNKDARRVVFLVNKLTAQEDMEDAIEHYAIGGSPIDYTAQAPSMNKQQILDEKRVWNILVDDLGLESIMDNDQLCHLHSNLMEILTAQVGECYKIPVGKDGMVDVAKLTALRS